MEATRRRLEQVAHLVAIFRRIARDEEGAAHAVAAAERVKGASERVAAAAARVVGRAVRPRDTAPAEFHRAIGSTQALPLIERIARELRAAVHGDAPLTPARAEAWHEFHQGIRAWDREIAASRLELTAAFACSDRRAPEADDICVALAGLSPPRPRTPPAAAPAVAATPDDGGRRFATDQSITRHFDRWIFRIQGQATDDAVRVVGDEIAAIAQREGIDPRTLDIYRIRQYLGRLRRSGLNNVSAAIMQYISGIAPPTLPPETVDRAAALFSEVVRVRRDVLHLTGGITCYPFLIYKILEAIIPPDAPHRRILFYIYLQKPKTLKAADQDWARTCRKIPSLPLHLPTSRGDSARYAPRPR